jgi:hypothetical protein
MADILASLHIRILMVIGDHVVYASYTPKETRGPPEQAEYKLTI